MPGPFSGPSTLHDFDGTGICEPSVLRAAETAGDEAIVPGTVLTVRVAGKHTGYASRDEKMREMSGADRFPLIAGVLGGAPRAELRRQLLDTAQGGADLSLCGGASATPMSLLPLG